MEILSFFTGNAFRAWAVQFLVVLFLVGGIVALVTGLCLAFNSAGTLRFLDRMNVWTSTRRAFKPIEIPRDTTQAVYRHRRWLAAFFVAGGAFAIYGLLAQFNAGAVIQLFGLGVLRPSFAGWVVDSARWVLVAGNLAGIAVGIALGFFPERLMALEARGSRWYSERQLAKDRDKMNLALDSWVAQFPRAAGWIITFFALVLIGAYGMMLPALR